MSAKKVALLATVTGFFMVGCHMDMWAQPKVKSQSENKFFADGKGTRDPIVGAVEFGKPKSDDAFYTGFENGKLVTEFPVEVDKEFILRGKERFEIFCSHCHGQLGDGKGMIAQRGFEMRRPVGDYHTDRLREMPIGHFYDVMTNGYGTMYPQGSKIEPEDRWAIAAYIRVLQLSQNASPADLDAATAAKLGASAGQGSGPLFKAKAGAVTTVPDPGPAMGSAVNEAGTAPAEVGH